MGMAAARGRGMGVLLVSLGSVRGRRVGSFAIDLIWPPEVPPSPVRPAVTVALASSAVVIAALVRTRLPAGRA